MSVVGPQSQQNFKWKAVIENAFKAGTKLSADTNKDGKYSQVELTERRTLVAERLSELNTIPLKKKDTLIQIEMLKYQMDALDLVTAKFSKVDKDGSGGIDFNEFKQLRHLAFNYAGAVAALA